MFSSFKSLSSNIASNYEISKKPSATAGAWQVFDAKKKNSGSLASVFVFERKALEVHSSGFGARPSATSIRKIQDEVVERLKKEASSLARLRHPSILQLVEPVEDTRNGGLMFATELVVRSLAGALSDSPGGVNGRGPRPGRGGKQQDEADEEVELDELEIQKGLLQVAKGLEFLHDSAKLVHGNLTPEAIFINAKSDWKIAGMAFTGPPDGAEGHNPIPQISLSEVLHHDARIPRSVQLNLDYSSPDFVLDSTVHFSADMFSLGLVTLAIYNDPHKSPFETNGNQNTYKKLYVTPSTTPTFNNNFLCRKGLPKELLQTLPRLLARQPAQRLTASEFQQSEYFDNILVNTIRFLDALPAKSPSEKAQFMKGLSRVMPQFPASVLGKKVLISLLEETKDKELLAPILQNVFQIIQIIPSRRKVCREKVLPTLREVFLAKAKHEERDTAKEAGLAVVLENMKLISENCSGKEFKDDVLPIIHLGMESSTNSLIDLSFQCLATILPILDFSTVKHDVFPVVASVFSKTSSLSIKVRGLEALAVLCGATASSSQTNDDLAGMLQTEATTSKAISSLDKFTVQEKVVPLLKGIKTKEPSVMMAALAVFQQVGSIADSDFVATEVMPILWAFSLGPLLNLPQFQAYMDLIKSLSSKIEREHIKKLRPLSGGNPVVGRSPLSTTSKTNEYPSSTSAEAPEEDFEKLVLSNRSEKPDVFAGALAEPQKLMPNPPTFSWSTVNGDNTTGGNLASIAALRPSPNSRSITPDVSTSSLPTLQTGPNPAAGSWDILTPAQPARPSLHTTPSLQPSQPLPPPMSKPNYYIPPPPSSASIWNTEPSTQPFAPAVLQPPPQQNPWQQSMSNIHSNAFADSSSGLAVPPKSGLDKYQSLL